ncbi:trans-sulfuration enzyme family protein [Fangia hongkongensis]|uniref:trans-sulfuration enzyme family protein n=1 Tax=Fangia hongkongensis TaxID=270495 RepID=UPI000360F4C1|nr:PLP-dependent transferase [Fangia hongkongensis]MBK2126359.1 PLP-dependent transferase [Fangia hongkongensis]
MDRWTELLHFDNGLNDPHYANSTPIYQSATFQQAPSFDEQRNYDYSRSGNPTRSVLEKQLAILENGHYGFAFNSGLSAIYATLQLLSAKDHLIIGDDVYGGTYRLVDKIIKRFDIEVSQVDLTDTNALLNAIRPNTKLLLLETPTNPFQHVSDIEAISNLLQSHNILFAIDNTFLSPWLQNPLSLGADIVIHSATKHLSGHSDITAGAVITNDKSLADEIAFIQNATGSALEALPAWLLLRGIKTLGLRIERAQENAQKIARFLASHPEVKNVYYTGLSSHQGYPISQKQTRGAGSVISFDTYNSEVARYLVDHSKLFNISVSFGGLQSAISLPFKMSHAAVDDPTKKVPTNLIRLSVGIEDPQDLINDLNTTLANAGALKSVL